MPKSPSRVLHQASHPTVILALDGVLDASLGVAGDVLRAADRVLAAMGRAPAFDARVASVRRSVRLASGMTLTTSGALASLKRPSIVVVPGLDALSPEVLDASLGTRDVDRAGRWLTTARSRGALIAAGCSSVFLLARLGFLNGRRATTMWALGPTFRMRFPEVELDLERSTVCSGDVWTAGAALSIADLSLAIVRSHAGADVAEHCLRYLALDTRPTQARYFVLDHLARTSPELSRAEAWARKHLARGFSIEELARQSGLSPRTLARRMHATFGTSPVRFVQRLRAEQAQHLLTTTAYSFEEICERVGYSDPAALRRVLKRETGTTARAIREESARRRAAP